MKIARGRITSKNNFPMLGKKKKGFSNAWKNPSCFNERDARSTFSSSIKSLAAFYRGADAEAQGVELDEAGGISLVVPALFVEADQLWIVERVG